MDGIVEAVQRFTEGTIDFEGQETAQSWTSLIIYAGVILSVIVGFLFQDLSYTWYGVSVTSTVLMIFCLPLPAYNRNPVKWQEPKIANDPITVAI